MTAANLTINQRSPQEFPVFCSLQSDYRKQRNVGGKDVENGNN